MGKECKREKLLKKARLNRESKKSHTFESKNKDKEYSIVFNKNV